jgi:uncharacterized damage-inducible protein DinB
MAIEINRIVKLFEALQHGDCWIGVNFKEALQGIDAGMAVQKISDDGNSIWMLVSHLIYWRTRVAHRLAGNDDLPPFKDFTLPADLHETNWKQTLLDFEAAYHTLRSAIHHIKDEQLDKPTVRPGQTYHQLLTGCLQHDAYHLGQIVLLKKKQ